MNITEGLYDLIGIIEETNMTPAQLRRFVELALWAVMALDREDTADALDGLRELAEFVSESGNG